MNKLVIVALFIIGAVLLMDSASAQMDQNGPPVLTSPGRKGLVKQNGEGRAFRHGLGLRNGEAFAKENAPTPPIPKILTSPPRKD